MSERAGRTPLADTAGLRIIRRGASPLALLGAAFQAFYGAALPVRYGVTVVEALDATPRKGTDFYCFAGHCASISVQSIFPFLGPVATSFSACGPF